MYYSQQTTKQTKEPACGTWMMCMDSRNSKIIERWGCIWCLGSRLVQRYNSLLDHIYIRPHFVVRKMRLEGKGLKPESHSWLVVKMDHFSKRCFVGGDSKPRVLVFVLSFNFFPQVLRKRSTSFIVIDYSKCGLPRSNQIFVSLRGLPYSS